MVILVGYSLIAFHFVVQILLDAVWLARGVDPPGWWIAEASHGTDAPPATGQDQIDPPEEIPHPGGVKESGE
jgi:hypothetical protein